MRVAALGRTRMLVDTIQALIEAGHEVPLIATCRSSERHTAREADFADLARMTGSDFLLAPSLNDPASVSRLRAARADVAVSVDWVNRIGGDACAAFRHGIFNVHAGDLPRYRGNAPVAWAILRGESQVGLTVHRMDPEQIDAGPVALKEFCSISEKTYVREVFDFIERRAPALLVEVVRLLATGSLTLTAQPDDPAAALRCYPRCPADGWLDWSLGARFLARLVRATAEPFSGAFTLLQGERLTVWRARAEPWDVPSLAVPGQVARRDSGSGEVEVATGDGVLVLEQVEQRTTGRVSAASVIKSAKERLGSLPPHTGA